MPIANSGEGGGGPVYSVQNLTDDSRIETDGEDAYPYGLSVMYSVDEETEDAFAWSWGKGFVVTERAADAVEDAATAVQSRNSVSGGFPHYRSWYPDSGGGNWSAWTNNPTTPVDFRIPYNSLTGEDPPWYYSWFPTTLSVTDANPGWPTSAQGKEYVVFTAHQGETDYYHTIQLATCEVDGKLWFRTFEQAPNEGAGAWRPWGTIYGIFGTPSDGDVATWNASAGHAEWSTP